MFRKSIPSIALVGIGNVLNAALGFLFLTAVAKTLPISEFGKYALLTSFLVFFSKIIDFGTNSIYVAHSIVKEKALKRQFIATKFALFTISLVGALIALTVFRLLNLETIFVFIGGLAGYGINYTLFAFFQKQQKFYLAVLLNTLPAIIKGVAALFVLGNFVKIDTVAALGVFSLSMLSSGILYAFLPKNPTPENVSLKEVLALIKTSLPAGVTLLINEGWPALTNSLTKIVKTFTDVGIFALANKIANIFTLLSLSIFTVLLPKNAVRKKENLKYNLKETGFLSAGILVLAAIAILVSKLFVIEIFGQKYEASIGILNILILGSAFTAIHMFMENFFYIEEKTKTLLTISLVKLVGFFIFAAFLIPKFALQGLAFSYLAVSLGAVILTLATIVES